jgi:hypothetical protein
MVSLIALLSTGKGTWSEVISLIKAKEWDNVFLIVNDFAKDNFTAPKNTKIILINSNNSIEKMISDIKKEIVLNDFEVALNMNSGTGQEHMALLEAVMELGLNFRLVTLNNKKEMVSLGINP